MIDNVTEAPTLDDLESIQINGVRLLEKVHSYNREVKCFVGYSSIKKKLVFVKFLAADHIKNHEYISEFINISNILSMVNVDNIVKVFDHGVSNGSLYIVTEYVAGVSIANIIMYDMLPRKGAIKIVKEIAYSLKKMHEYGVLHLGISPFNLIITDSGTVKIVDFGIDHCMRDIEDSKVLKNSHISPEASGKTQDSIDAGSDVYSLGVILQELLTGEFANGVLNVENIPMGLGDIIRKATLHNTQKRFLSMQDFLGALTSFEKGDSLYKNATSGEKRLFRVNDIEKNYKIICPEILRGKTDDYSFIVRNYTKGPKSTTCIVKEVGGNYLVCFIECAQPCTMIIPSIAFGMMSAYLEHIGSLHDIKDSFSLLFGKSMLNHHVSISLLLINSALIKVFLPNNYKCYIVDNTTSSLSIKEVKNSNAHDLMNISVKKGIRVLFFSKPLKQDADLEIDGIGDLSKDCSQELLDVLIKNNGTKNVMCTVVTM